MCLIGFSRFLIPRATCLVPLINCVRRFLRSDRGSSLGGVSDKACSSSIFSPSQPATQFSLLPVKSSGFWDRRSSCCFFCFLRFADFGSPLGRGLHSSNW